jgi:hypothetical protein
MSTSEQSVGIQAEHPAERALFRALFDDAAVFPPGLAPLPQAVADHAARQTSSYADLVGPLLLPASLIEDFIHCERPRQMDVALIGRPGTDLAFVDAARSRFDADPGLRPDGNHGANLKGIEIGWSPDWHQALSWRGASLSVEVPNNNERAGNEQAPVLSDIQEHAGGHGTLVRAKFRTGSTPDAPIPTPTELATFIHTCVDLGLGFKLTGGLHHAISQTTPDGEAQFGFLNVLAATHWALSHGAKVPEMETLLSQRDPKPILDIITRMSDADARAVRTFFTAYGCCGVLDPIGDLASLGLIKETTV